MKRVVFAEAARTEAIGLWEVSLVTMYCPQVPRDRRSLRNAVSLLCSLAASSCGKI